ncbi:hypothetical protein WCN91_13305 [Pseudoalteromonas sp. YIC-827]|uniref:DRBM domain-containing protein n=1 Tax=Pseudoalteromonas qingdaonensis TaxID=3131913 RepID=A0ABU9MYS8_9GAMM
MSRTDTDLRTLNGLAINFISKDPDFRLPEPLRSSLNNVFIRGKSSYQSEIVICNSSESFKNNKFTVKKAKVNAIYNALCLLTLTDTKNVKKVFDDYHKSKINRTKFKVTDNSLRSSSDEHLAAILFFQVTQDIRERVIKQLEKPTFDLFEHKLTSPFKHINGHPDDLKPMEILFDENICWLEVTEKYNLAEKFFANSDCRNALETIRSIGHRALENSPTCKALTLKTKALQQEAEDAWNYFQRIIK